MERISDSLGIKEVFGYLATMLEEWHCKIILISNEEEYKNVKEIKRIKEKVINKSLEFNISVSDVAEDVIKGNLKNIDEKDDTINDWIIDESKFLLSNVDDINLRTVKSVMSTYAELVERVNKEEIVDEQKEQIKKTGFLSIFVLTDCFKRGIPIDDEHTEGLFGNSAYINLSSISKLGRSSSVKEPEHERGFSITTGKIHAIFHKKSNDFDANILYTLPIRDLIEHDFLNFPFYVTEIKQHFFHEDSAFQELFNFRELSDSELENIQNEISDKLDCNNDDVDYLVQILLFFLFFEEKGLNLGDLRTDELRKKIRERISTIDKAEIEKINWKIIGRNLGNEKWLVKAVDSRKKELSKEADNDLLESVLSHNWYEKRRNREFFEEQSFFKMLIDSNEVNKIVQAGQSSDIQSLVNYISAEREQFVRDIYNNDEPEYAREFAKELKRLELRVKGKVQLFNYQELESKVNEIDKGS